MTHITNISEAKATLSKLIDQVMQGQEVVIGKAGKPVARLVPYNVEPSAAQPRQLGIGDWKGKIWIADDCDDLPVYTAELWRKMLDRRKHVQRSRKGRGHG